MSKSSQSQMTSFMPPWVTGPMTEKHPVLKMKPLVYPSDKHPHGCRRELGRGPIRKRRGRSGTRAPHTQANVQTTKNDTNTWNSGTGKRNTCNATYPTIRGLSDASRASPRNPTHLLRHVRVRLRDRLPATEVSTNSTHRDVHQVRAVVPVRSQGAFGESRCAWKGKDRNG